MQKVAHWSDSNSYFLSNENCIGSCTHFFPISETTKSDRQWEQAVTHAATVYSTTVYSLAVKIMRWKQMAETIVFQMQNTCQRSMDD